MLLRERELERHQNRIAVLRSAESVPITIRPNTEIVINGQLDRKLSFPQVCALIQPTHGSAIPADMDIVPSIVSYNHQSRDIIKAYICNVSTRTATIQPRTLLCELQPVAIEDASRIE